MRPDGGEGPSWPGAIKPAASAFVRCCERLTHFQGAFEKGSGYGQGPRDPLKLSLKHPITGIRDMTIKILIADDHEIMREGLSSLIAKQSDMEVVGQAPGGREAVKMARQLNPDVIIMDINMPGMDGIEATQSIHQHNPGAKIVILSMYSNKHFLIKGMKAGAQAYLLKEQAFQELIAAIHAVLNENTYLCSKMTSVVVDDFFYRVVRDEKTAVPTLSEKESDILCLLAEGKSSKEIASLLRKSSKTVDAYRRQIMNKLGTNNLVDLVKFALREGLISMEK